MEIISIRETTGQLRVNRQFWLYFVRDVFEYTYDDEITGHAMFNRLPNHIRIPMIQKGLVPKFNRHIDPMCSASLVKRYIKCSMDWIGQYTSGRHAIYIPNWDVYMLYSYDHENAAIFFKYKQTESAVIPFIDTIILQESTENWLAVQNDENGARSLTYFLQEQNNRANQRCCSCDLKCCKYHEEPSSDSDGYQSVTYKDRVLFGEGFIEQMSRNQNTRGWTLNQSRNLITLDQGSFQAKFSTDRNSVRLSCLNIYKDPFYGSAIKTIYSSSSPMIIQDVKRARESTFITRLANAYKESRNLSNPDFRQHRIKTTGSDQISKFVHIDNIMGETFSLEIFTKLPLTYAGELLEIHPQPKRRYRNRPHIIEVPLSTLEFLDQQFCDEQTRDTCPLQASIYAAVFFLKHFGIGSIQIKIEDPSQLTVLDSLTSLRELKALLQRDSTKSFSRLYRLDASDVSKLFAFPAIETISDDLTEEESD